jgi:hypothetical protein
MTDLIATRLAQRTAAEYAMSVNAKILELLVLQTHPAPLKGEGPSRVTPCLVELCGLFLLLANRLTVSLGSIWVGGLI